MANRDQAVIGYILKGYGRTSETFISNEIALLEQSGLRIQVFSLKRLVGEKAHGVTQRIRVPVTYLPEISSGDGKSLLAWLQENWPNFAAAHRRLLTARPMAWMLTFGGLILRGWRESAAARRTALREFLQAGFIAAALIDGPGGEITHLHAHFAHTATTVAMLAARLSGRPFSFTAHAKDIYRVDMNPGNLLTRKLQSASFTVTCTRANVDYLARLSNEREKIHRIYHGIDLQLFQQNRPAESHTSPLILAVGRFVEKKGFPILIEACRMLRDDGVNFQVRIVGGFTPLTAEIEQLIAQLGLGEQILLQPAMTQEELTRLYAAATLFALPSLVTDDGDRDGIPNVLAEAMAMGLPVVSTRISGIPELVRNGETGLLVAERDPVALAAAIRRLLEDMQLREELGRRGRELVEQEFDARRNISALKELFQSVRETGRNGVA